MYFLHGSIAYFCEFYLRMLHTFWPIHGWQPCRGEGVWITQWSYEPCWAGPLKTDGSWWKVLTKHSPLEEDVTTHSSTLARRTLWTVWKGIKDLTPENGPHRSEGVQYITGKEQRAVTNNSGKNEAAGPERKQDSVVDVMKVKSSAVKNNVA